MNNLVPWLVENNLARTRLKDFLFCQMPLLKKRFDWYELERERELALCIEYLMVGLYLHQFDILHVQQAIHYNFRNCEAYKTNLTMSLGGAL